MRAIFELEVFDVSVSSADYGALTNIEQTTHLVPLASMYSPILVAHC